MVPFIVVLPGFSFVKPIFIGNKTKSKSRSIEIMAENYFVIEHVQSSEEEHVSEDQSLSANCSPLNATSCSGEYIVW
jgi:hypothetical protein